MKMNTMIIIIIGAVLVISGAVYLALGASGMQDNRTSTVSGVVMDQNKVGVPGATVTMWKAQENSSIPEQYDNINIVDMPGNPQTTNDGRSAAPGVYTFEKVPYGLYNITAEKDGHMYYHIGDINNGSMTINIFIPDYAVPASSTGYATISGIVTDERKVGLIGATVTLWNGTYDKVTGKFTNMEISRVNDNPQTVNNGSTGAIGMYTLRNVPWGAYNLTAEKDGKLNCTVVTLGPDGEMGTATHNPQINGTSES